VLAREFGLPVIVHVRKAVDAVLHILRAQPVAGGSAHAFNGSAQQAQAFIARGFKLGFGGAVTYECAHKVRQLAARLLLDSLVLETDAPDMPDRCSRQTARSNCRASPRTSRNGAVSKCRRWQRPTCATRHCAMCGLPVFTPPAA